MLKESLTAKEQRAAILQTEVLYLLIVKCNRNIEFMASIEVWCVWVKSLWQESCWRIMNNLKQLKCLCICCECNFGCTPALILEFFRNAYDCLLRKCLCLILIGFSEGRWTSMTWLLWHHGLVASSIRWLLALMVALVDASFLYISVLKVKLLVFL